jgi:hypothetical protein
MNMEVGVQLLLLLLLFNYVFFEVSAAAFFSLSSRCINIIKGCTFVLSKADK